MFSKKKNLRNTISEIVKIFEEENKSKFKIIQINHYIKIKQIFLFQQNINKKKTIIIIATSFYANILFFITNLHFMHVKLNRLYQITRFFFNVKPKLKLNL